MKRIKRTIAQIALMTLVSASAWAQDSNESKTKFSIEIDPATFAFKGYGVHLRLQPKNSEHLLIGAGAYAMDMPDVIINMDKQNKNKGWDVRLNQGVGLFSEYHFSEVNTKWFIGVQASIQQYKIEHTDLVNETTFSNLLSMGYFGYTWKPFKNQFYIKPWMGLGYVSKINGENATYHIAPITAFMTVHLGYTF